MRKTCDVVLIVAVRFSGSNAVFLCVNSQCPHTLFCLSNTRSQFMLTLLQFMLFYSFTTIKLCNCY